MFLDSFPPLTWHSSSHARLWHFSPSPLVAGSQVGPLPLFVTYSTSGLSEYEISYCYPLLKIHSSVQFSSVQLLSCVDSLRPHELQHARPPRPSLSPGVHSNSCPSSWWCHPVISSSVTPLSSHPHPLLLLPPIPLSIRVFSNESTLRMRCQSTGVSALASFLPKNIQDWSPLEQTGWISLQSKGLSRVFSNTAVQKHQFFGTQLSSQSNSHIHTWPQEKP